MGWGPGGCGGAASAGAVWPQSVGTIGPECFPRQKEKKGRQQPACASRVCPVAWNPCLTHAPRAPLCLAYNPHPQPSAPPHHVPADLTLFVDFFWSTNNYVIAMTPNCLRNSSDIGKQLFCSLLYKSKNNKSPAVSIFKLPCRSLLGNL